MPQRRRKEPCRLSGCCDASSAIFPLIGAIFYSDKMASQTVCACVRRFRKPLTHRGRPYHSESKALSQRTAGKEYRNMRDTSKGAQCPKPASLGPARLLKVWCHPEPQAGALEGAFAALSPIILAPRSCPAASSLAPG